MENARFVTIKDESGIPEKLKGILSFQVSDGNVEAVVVKINDQFVRIVKSETYSTTLKVLTQAPKKQVEKWLLSGKYMGMVDVSELYDDHVVANERLAEYQEKSHWTDNNLEVKSVFVEEDETKLV